MEIDVNLSPSDLQIQCDSSINPSWIFSLTLMRFSESNTEFLWASDSTDNSKEQGGRTSSISIRTYYRLFWGRAFSHFRSD